MNVSLVSVSIVAAFKKNRLKAIFLAWFSLDSIQMNDVKYITQKDLMVWLTFLTVQALNLPTHLLVMYQQQPTSTV